MLIMGHRGSVKVFVTLEMVFMMGLVVGVVMLEAGLSEGYRLGLVLVGHAVSVVGHQVLVIQGGGDFLCDQTGGELMGI